MWVGEGGSILGNVTIGGCVDAEVVRVAEDVLRALSPALLSLELGDDDAHELGLTCAGEVDVLVQQLNLAGDDPLLEAWDRIRAHTTRGGRAVMITLLPDGSLRTPERGAGVLVVQDDGARWGTLGSAALDAAAVPMAEERLARGGARTLQIQHAGRSLDAYFEVYGRGPSLVIVGAGAITAPLATMARLLGYHVTVVDARERFAGHERVPDADEMKVGMPSDIVGEMEFDASSAIVLVAHDYKFDIPVLRAVLGTDVGYIGMLGSRKRSGTILQMLEEEGAAAASLARVRTPIGLDIGSQSAAEIALSILAELVAVRNGRSGGSMRARNDARSAGA